MTARTQQANGTHIQLDQWDVYEEVARDYTRELREQGHDMLDTRCRGCGREWRAYMFTNLAEIFSDFHEGEQCWRRQMNLHGEGT